MTAGELEQKVCPMLMSTPVKVIKRLAADKLCTTACLQHLCPASKVEVPCKGAGEGEAQKIHIAKKCFFARNINNTVTTLQRLQCGCLPLKQSFVDDLKTVDECRALGERRKHCSDAGSYSDEACKQIILEHTLHNSTSDMADLVDTMSELPAKLVCDSVDSIKSTLIDPNLEVTPSQATCMVERILNETSNETSISWQDFFSFYGAAALGLSVDQIFGFSSYWPDRMAMAGQLCSKEGWPDEKLSAIMDFVIKQALTDRLPANSTENYLTSLTRDDVAALGAACLSKFSSDNIASTTDDVCKDICAKIGPLKMFTCMENQQMCTSYATQCVACLGRNTTGTLSIADIRSLGNLLCCVTPEDFQKVKNVTEKADVFRLLSSCRPRRDFVTYVNRSASDVLVTILGDPLTEELPSGFVLASMQAAIRASDSVQTLYEMIADKASTLITPTGGVGEYTCQKIDTTETPLELSLLIKDAVANTMNTTQTVRRRKRSTVTTVYSCADIKTLSGAVTSLTEDELRNIPADDLTECLAVLGSSKWAGHAAKKRVLIDRVAKDLVSSGSICDASSIQLQEMNHINTAMTSSEIACLTNVTSDVMNKMGKISTWTLDQLEYCIIQNFGDVST